MKKDRLTYLQNILLPCLLFSSLAGILTGLTVFLFRLAAGAVVSLSEEIYAAVRANPILLPALLVGAALVGLLAALILRHAKSCRGGGIPTAVALLRGLIRFPWINSIFVLFPTAMLSFLAGLPLGSEGPCVQMGTAVGSGTVRIFAKKHQAWERYIMTGGACAGFAAATGAPISGIFFAFEEAHRRFSPMLFMSAAMAILTSTVTTQLLCDFSGIRFTMFAFVADSSLPLSFLWAALPVGILSGLFAILFTKAYHVVGKFVKKTLAAIPFIPKLMLVFVAVAICGFASGELIGSGHHLIAELLSGKGIWYLLLIALAVRTLMLLLSNRAGATGGLFVPSLAFGAIIGALAGDALIAMTVLPAEYRALMVVIGMASFLSASARTPIMALTFAAEALCGFSNILPVAVGVTAAFLIIEAVGVAPFNDTVIESKVEAEHRGKTAQVVETHLKVGAGSFAVGKETRDILWPPACVILSVGKQRAGADYAALEVGDSLHVRYQTYDPVATAAALASILGEQELDPSLNSFEEDGFHRLPEQ